MNKTVFILNFYEGMKYYLLGQLSVISTYSYKKNNRKKK